MSLQPTSRRVRLLAGAAAALLLFGACTSDDGGDSSGDRAAQQGGEQSAEPVENTRPQTKILASSGGFCDPKKVKVGATEAEFGTLIVFNNHDRPVTFALSAVDADVKIQPGQRSRLDYAIPDTFEPLTWECRFDGGNTTKGKVAFTS